MVKGSGAGNTVRAVRTGQGMQASQALMKASPAQHRGLVRGVCTKLLATAPVLLGTLWCGSAQAGDFLDTWITFAFEDPHVLAGVEDGYPLPGFFPDDRAQTFFDNYDTMYSGRETKTELALYKRMPRYVPGFDAEWSLVTRYTIYHNTETGKPYTKLKDDGSYIRLFWNPESARKANTSDGLSLTLFPYDSERFKLGYSYDLTWGGKRTFVGNLDEVPGFKLEYTATRGDSLKLNAFVGAKTARLIDESLNEQNTYYGVLAGAGLDLNNRIKLDLQAGFFEKAAFPPKVQTGDGQTDPLAGEPIQAGGVSLRAGYHMGTPIGRSADFKLYRQDPYALAQDLKPEQYDSRLSWVLESELTMLRQTMIASEPKEDGTYGTVWQPAAAGDINLRLKYHHLRANLNYVYRSLSFILFNVPGMSPYYEFPSEATITDERYFALGADFNLPKTRLTPGLTLGYQSPASYMGAAPAEFQEEGSGTTTIVVRDEGNFEILPPDQNKFDILVMKTSLRWELGESLNFLSELSYTLDKNQTRYERGTDTGGSTRIFDDPDVYNKISVSAFLQARF